MPRTIIMSIKPEYANKLLSGKKLYEFRRRVGKDIGRVVIYATAPVMKVIGEFTVEKTLKLPPMQLWEQCRDGAGIGKKLFEYYFIGADYGFALQVKETKKYESPKHISEYGLKRPPQSWQYLKAK